MGNTRALAAASARKAALPLEKGARAAARSSRGRTRKAKTGRARRFETGAQGETVPLKERSQGETARVATRETPRPSRRYLLSPFFRLKKAPNLSSKRRIAKTALTESLKERLPTASGWKTRISRTARARRSSPLISRKRRRATAQEKNMTRALRAEGLGPERRA